MSESEATARGAAAAQGDDARLHGLLNGLLQLPSLVQPAVGAHLGSTVVSCRVAEQACTIAVAPYKHPNAISFLIALDHH